MKNNIKRAPVKFREDLLYFEHFMLAKLVIITTLKESSSEGFCQFFASQLQRTYVCIPILVTTFLEWLSGTKPFPHTPGAVRPSSLCV